MRLYICEFYFSGNWVPMYTPQSDILNAKKRLTAARKRVPDLRWRLGVYERVEAIEERENPT